MAIAQEIKLKETLQELGFTIERHFGAGTGSGYVEATYDNLHVKIRFADHEQCYEADYSIHPGSGWTVAKVVRDLARRADVKITRKQNWTVIWQTREPGTAKIWTSKTVVNSRGKAEQTRDEFMQHPDTVNVEVKRGVHGPVLNR